jgi:prevent-host-death family protein
MKTMTVFEARNHFARTIEAAKEDIIIVTRNGRPVAAIQGIDDDDIEDLLLERSERFWAMIARARRGKSIDIETLRKQVTGGRPPAGETFVHARAVRNGWARALRALSPPYDPPPLTQISGTASTPARRARAECRSRRRGGSS